MLEPANILTSILLRISAPLRPPPGTVQTPSQPDTLPASPTPQRLTEGQTLNYTLQLRDGGRGTPVLILPKQGMLQIKLALLGEQLLLNHPVTSQSQTERIALPAPLASHGELWLVRQPEQQFLLLWLPLSFPPIPLHQLQLSLQQTQAGAKSGRGQFSLGILGERRYLKACTIFIALCIMLALI